MDIKDCKIGTRVVCINEEDGNIPSGALGTIIEDHNTCPYVAWDECFNDIQFGRDGHKNVYAMCLREIEVWNEIPTKETNIGKLTVSLATEDVNEIAKDILKVVLQELYVGIEALSVSLSKDLDESEVGCDVTPKESLVTEQDVLDNLLNQINLAINSCDDDTAVKLSEAYQRIKSISINNNQTI